MPSVAAVVAQLVAAPKPVLCLDTCDILEVVQCLPAERLAQAGAVGCAGAVRRLLDTLAANPDRVQPVVTELVATEWGQNIAKVRSSANDHLARIDNELARLHRAAAAINTPVAAFPPLAASTLVGDLVALSRSLLDQAVRLELEPALVQRAVDRVYSQTPPSLNGNVKDSIHLEHYLEFARQLRAMGFADRCLFVSGNKKDFWDSSNAKLHPSLVPELDDVAVQLGFFPSLQAALGFLRI